MSDERTLFDAFAKASDGYQRDAVIGAAGNMILNGLRQSHKRLGDAEEELDALVVKLKRELARRHYDQSGARLERRLIIPTLVLQG